MLAAIAERVPDPSVFETNPPVFMRVTASTRAVDAYFTRMSESSLRNYAADAIDGVSFLNSHNMRSLGFGQTFDGRYVAGANERTEVDLYVLSGLKLNETANDDFIAAVRGGSIKDVSIGFLPGSYRCSICDTKMARFFGMAIPTCGHWPGDEYPVSEKDPSKGTRTAFAWVDDAHLSEVSAVGDGATPGAQITEVRARALVADGRGPSAVLAALEERYLLTRSFPVPAITTPEVVLVDLTDADVAAIRLALTETGAAPDAPVPTTVRALVDELATLRALPAEVARLTPLAAEADTLRALADEGRQYRADLVETAISEGKRAMGASFAEATYRALLTSASIETVKTMAADWKAAGDRMFPGGRLSQDAPIATNGAAAGAVPDAAFRTGR